MINSAELWLLFAMAELCEVGSSNFLVLWLCRPTSLSVISMSSLETSSEMESSDSSKGSRLMCARSSCVGDGGDSSKHWQL